MNVTATKQRVGRKRAAHVRLLPPGTFFCSHCGEKYAMAMPAPVSIMAAACEAFAKEHRRCPVRHTGPACTYCLAFGHAPKDCPSLEYRGDVLAWWRGPDTGRSSKTLCVKLSAVAAYTDVDAPSDPSDFGRCYRFLKAFPQYRPRVSEMWDVPGWAGLAAAWDELEKLYEEELPSGQAPKLWARMRELRGES